MKKTATILLAALLLGGCHKKLPPEQQFLKDFADQLASNPASACLNPVVKSALRLSLRDGINHYLTPRGPLPEDNAELIRAGKVINLHDFVLNNYQPASRRLSCHVQFDVTIHSLARGNITVNPAAIDYDIISSDDGPTVTFPDSNLNPFLQNLAEQLKAAPVAGSAAGS